MELGRKRGWARAIAAATLLLGSGAPGAAAADNPGLTALHVTLANGSDLICDHREAMGDRVRLYLRPGSESFVEVAKVEILNVELGPAWDSSSAGTLPLPAGLSSQGMKAPGMQTPGMERADPTPDELRGMMSRAGAKHNLDVDLLASVIRAESGGNIRAVSRTGARGLMQLMPSTATLLGVVDSFHPEQNINGGTAYLDWLLLRYHGDILRALAAYNAGPAAVDRYHGIPPYRETRAYVARVVAEFDRRSDRRKALAKKDRGEALTASRSQAPSLGRTQNPTQ